MFEIFEVSILEKKNVEDHNEKWYYNVNFKLYPDAWKGYTPRTIKSVINNKFIVSSYKKVPVILYFTLDKRNIKEEIFLYEDNCY